MAENTIDPSKQHGAFSWNELMTTNLDEAKSFYTSMFNWQFEDLQMEEPYSIAKIGGQEVSGVMPIPPEAEGMPPMWGGYITVDDVDQSAKQAVSLGGKVLLEPRNIPEVGTFAVISDPQGAVFSIMTYAQEY